MITPFKQPQIIAYSNLFAQSYADWVGRKLTESSDIAYALYRAPFALVSHGTESDPVFRYANITAQKLGHLPWNDFTRMPSRLTAEPIDTSDRQRLLDEAARKVYVDNYTGVLITRDGRLFVIEYTTLWKVFDTARVLQGQAAVINGW